jgi:hypothetical protein
MRLPWRKSKLVSLQALERMWRLSVQGHLPPVVSAALLSNRSILLLESRQDYVERQSPLSVSKTLSPEFAPDPARDSRQAACTKRLLCLCWYGQERRGLGDMPQDQPDARGGFLGIGDTTQL